jgi:hypothetical protein
VSVSGLDGRRAVVVDSVYISAGGETAFATQMYRVNSARWWAPSANVGQIRVYSTSLTDSSGTLAVIPIGATISSMGIYSFPAGRQRIEPRGLRVVFSQGSSAGAGGAIGVVIRRPGQQTWEVLQEGLFTSGSGQIDLPFPVEMVDPTPAIDIADACVRLAPTNAAIDARAEWTWMFSDRR